MLDTWPIWFYLSASCATFREFIAELLYLSAFCYVAVDSSLLISEICEVH